MNEVLSQFLTSGLIGFLYGIFEMWVIVPLLVVWLAAFILGMIYFPDMAGESVKEGLVLWRFGVSIMAIIIFCPVGKWIKNKFKRWRQNK